MGTTFTWVNATTVAGTVGSAVARGQGLARTSNGRRHATLRRIGD
jgi:hypothetical protein